MPVELRKRKAHQLPAPAPAPKKPTNTKASGKAKAIVEKVKEAVLPSKSSSDTPSKAQKAKNSKEPAVPEESTTTALEEPAPPAPVSGKIAVGDTIDLDVFGGEIETNDGKKTTLKELLEESKAGVVLFTYPKASTPGCTTQVCLFRDSYEALTVGGLSIYGLSADSPKANTTFKDKQKLPYPLLCDPKSTLIAAIGLQKTPKGTQRGVFVVNKEGKVLIAEPGSPAGTHARVKKLVEES